MTLCHENNVDAIYVGRAVTVHNPLFYCSHYRNVSIGQLLQRIANSIVVCTLSRAKRLTKTYNKEVCHVS